MFLKIKQIKYIEKKIYIHKHCIQNMIIHVCFEAFLGPVFADVNRRGLPLVQMHSVSEIF